MEGSKAVVAQLQGQYSYLFQYIWLSVGKATDSSEREGGLEGHGERLDSRQTLPG